MAFSVGDQSLGAPNGVDSQSCLRMSDAISPSPAMNAVSAERLEEEVKLKAALLAIPFNGQSVVRLEAAHFEETWLVGLRHPYPS